MTKATLSALVSIVVDSDVEDKDAILTELNKELHRGDAVKAEKAQTYDSAWESVREILATASNGATVAEIFDSLGEGVLTKGQLTYALGHQWADLVVKTTGKVNTYALKA